MPDTAAPGGSWGAVLLPREALIRGLRIPPTVQRSAGNPLEHHDLARSGNGECRKDEIFADSRRDVESDAGRRIRRKSGHVGQGQRALRLVERRTAAVALEQFGD